MGPCKHGHYDGALHVPCYQCKSEYYEANLMLLAFLQKAKEAKSEYKEDGGWKSTPDGGPA